MASNPPNFSFVYLKQLSNLGAMMNYTKPLLWLCPNQVALMYEYKNKNIKLEILYLGG